LSSRSRSPERVSFANINEALQLPDLIAIQRDSFQWFLDKGLAEAYHDISPIEDFTGQLSLELEFDPTDPDLRPPPKFSVEECKEKDMTYAAPVFVRARFLNATTGEIKEQTVFMGDFPMMTERGTFIVNGTERVVVSQLVRSPGVIFQPGRDIKTVFTGTIHPYRGEWIELDIEAKPGKDVTAGCRVARKRRLSLFVLLRALGYGDEAFLDRFVRHFDFLEGQWEKERNLTPTREEALLEIYKRARPAPVRRSSAGVLRKRLLQPEALRPHAGWPLQVESQARTRDRSPVGPLRHRDREARAQPERPQPLGDPGLGHLHVASRTAHGRR
jgi:DNA-directed RNA polymerase subunit beta